MNWFKAFWKALTTPSNYPRTDVPPTGIQPFTKAEECPANLAPDAREVMALARKEAERLHHNFVGTEHLLLGLLTHGRGVAINVLQKLGLDPAAVRREVEAAAGGAVDQVLVGTIPYTPRVRKVLSFAAKQARALNHRFIGTEHILLAFLIEADGMAARVLLNLGMTVERTREEILKELDPNHTLGTAVTENPPAATPQPSPASVSGSTTILPTARRMIVDTTKRYDVYCSRWGGEMAYRNVLFKGVRSLLQQADYDPFSDFLELEQEDGKTVFVARSSVSWFCEHGSVTPPEKSPEKPL